MSNTPESEHDTQLCELYRQLAKADQQVAWKLSPLRHATEIRDRYWAKDVRPISEVLDAIVALIDAGDERLLMHSARPSEMLAYYNEAVEAFRSVQALLNFHEQAYTGWSRYFLVTSSSGLVHSSMSCSTCNKGKSLTTFALLPEMSGHPSGDLVEAVGPMLCSVCFPDAPVAWQEQDRVPARIAEVLFAKGYADFKAELDKFQAKRAAKKEKGS